MKHFRSVMRSMSGYLGERSRECSNGDRTLFCWRAFRLTGAAVAAYIVAGLLLGTPSR